MRPDRQMSILKWAAVAASVVWIIGAGWGELSKMRLPDDFRSASYRRESENCAGSFAKRYECKSQIIIGNDNDAFYDWALRLAIVFAPPILIGVLFSKVQQRRERQAEEERERRAIAQLKRIRAEQAEIRRLNDQTRRVAEDIATSHAPRRPA